MECGKFDLNARRFSRLEVLGKALDSERQLYVFDGGLIGFGDETESEVIADVAQGQARRSPTGSRSRRRTSSVSRRRAPGTGHHFRSEAHEGAFGAEFRILAQHYDALAFEDKHGLWVAVSSMPLGIGGPQAHFLVGILQDRRVLPRAWAFERIGLRSRTMSLKHTNFPDASVCAFLAEDNAWSLENGLLGFADHLTIWAIKKLHRDYIGWWPGPQFGFGALYRRLEFRPEEWCGCCSGKRYGECHQAVDLLVDAVAANAEFARAFGGNYQDREFPKEILEAARSRWKHLPSLRQAFSHRPLKLELGREVPGALLQHI